MILDAAFHALTAEEKNDLLAAGNVVTYETGETVIAENETVDSLLVIKLGSLRVTRTYLDDMTAEFAGPLGPGEVIGEMSFIDGKGASASLIADGQVEILSVSRHAVFEMLDADLGFKARFFESLFMDLSRKLRSTNQRVLPVAP